MRYAIVLAVVLSVPVMLVKPQDQAKRKIPCKTRENASMCYWTRGRLGVYSGNPSFRIWKVGTDRIVGIHSGPEAQAGDVLDGEHPEFPANIRRVAAALTEGRRIFANFEICPFAPDRPREMQFGCIESARDIALEK